jgi:protein SCO1/2
MARSKGAKIRISLSFALAIAAGYLMIPPPPDRGSGMVTRGSLGGPFSLTDHTGKTVTDEDFRGSYMLIYFGYTSCPDVCPLDLQFMTGALHVLGAAADQIQPILITVDPLRDTPAVLAGYVAAYHPRLIGLTGTVEQITAVAKSYAIFHEQEEGVAELATAYLVAHTTATILMGPDGKFLRVFSHGTGPAEYVAGLREHL